MIEHMSDCSDFSCFGCEPADDATMTGDFAASAGGEKQTFAEGYNLCFNELTKAVDLVLFEANREKEVIPFEIISQISSKMKELQLEH